MDVGHYGWTKRLDYYQTHPEFVIAPVPVTPNYGVFNVGAGPFDGVSSGFFNGHSQGTQFAINTAASFNGNIIDCQRGGSKRLLVTSAATTFILNSPTGGSTYGLLNLGPDNFNGNVGDFNGVVPGTYIAINALSSFTGNYIDCQKFGVDKFVVDASGNVTASGSLNLSAQPDIQALVWMEAM